MLSILKLLFTPPNCFQFDIEEVLKARNVREFDSLVVVPTFGFRDVDDYYTQV